MARLCAHLSDRRLRRCHACGWRDIGESVAAADHGPRRRNCDRSSPVRRRNPFSIPTTRACSVPFARSPDRPIAAFEHIQSQRASPFSVREWVENALVPGVLFIPYKAGQIAALRSMIATWMRLAIFEAMSQPEGRDQRLWFVVDELDALGAIDGLKDALARLRKFGVPLRPGISVRCPGLQYLWAERRADPGRELRQYADSALLGQRKRRHLAIRVPAHRRPGNPRDARFPRQRS